MPDMGRRLALALAIALVGCRAQRNVKLDAPLGAARSVRVELARAKVRVTAATGSRIVVTGRITRDRGLLSSDELGQAGVEIVQDHGIAIVRENAFARREEESGSVDRPLQFNLDVAMPRVPVSIQQSAGMVTVIGDFPAVRAWLGAGQVNIRIPAQSIGHIEAHGMAGEVELRLPNDREKHSLLMGAYTRDLGGSANIDTRVGAGQIIVENLP